MGQQEYPPLIWDPKIRERTGSIFSQCMYHQEKVDNEVRLMLLWVVPLIPPIGLLALFLMCFKPMRTRGYWWKSPSLSPVQFQPRQWSVPAQSLKRLLQIRKMLFLRPWQKCMEWTDIAPANGNYKGSSTLVIWKICLSQLLEHTVTSQ